MSIGWWDTALLVISAANSKGLYRCMPAVERPKFGVGIVYLGLPSRIMVVVLIFSPYSIGYRLDRRVMVKRSQCNVFPRDLHAVKKDLLGYLNL